MTHAREVVGDDVVDLGDPEALPAALHPRFADRILTDAERARVDAAPDRARLLWAHFAAKEAAFKAVSKLRPGLVFAHQQFEVDAELHSVRHEDLLLRLDVERTGELVHAVAWTGDSAPLASVAAVSGDPGVAARRLLCDALSQALRCPASELQVIRDPDKSRADGFGPPRVIRRGAALAVDVSLSHHGRFAACAAAG